MSLQPSSSSTVTARRPGEVRSGISRRLAAAGLPALGIVLFLGLWQLLAAGPLRGSGLPRTLGTLDALAGVVSDAAFWHSVGATVLQAWIGFTLSLAVALPLGLYVGTSPFGYHATRLVIEILKPIPAIVVLPLAVLQLGTSARLSVFLVAFTLIPMLTVTVAAGARDTDPVMLDAARSYGLRRPTGTWRVVIPSAVPFLATGLRVGAAFALIIAVVAGLYGGTPGLGRDLDLYRQAGAVETAFAYVFALGVLGIVLNTILGVAERRILFWHESVRVSPGRSGVLSRSALRTPVERTRLWAILDGLQVVVHRVAATSALRLLGRAVTPRRLGLSDRAWGRFLRAVLVLVPLTLAAVWWVASSNSTNPFFPPLSAILRSFHDVWLGHGALENALPSLRNLAVGFVLGSACGVLAGAVIGQVRWLLLMLNPLISFFRAVPSIAYLPILIAIIGFSSTMRITAITLAAFFPILIASIDGVRSIDETMLDATRSYRLPRLIALFSVRLPAALPRIFVGAELGLVAALIVMVASELIGASEGIGAQVLLAQQTFQFSDMWAGLLLLAVIGIATNLVFRLARRWMLSWYDGARAASKAQ